MQARAHRNAPRIFCSKTRIQHWKSRRSVGFAEKDYYLDFTGHLTRELSNQFELQRLKKLHKENI